MTKHDGAQASLERANRKARAVRLGYVLIVAILAALSWLPSERNIAAVNLVLLLCFPLSVVSYVVNDLAFGIVFLMDDRIEIAICQIIWWALTAWLQATLVLKLISAWRRRR